MSVISDCKRLDTKLRRDSEEHARHLGQSDGRARVLPEDFRLHCASQLARYGLHLALLKNPETLDEVFASIMDFLDAKKSWKECEHIWTTARSQYPQARTQPIQAIFQEARMIVRYCFTDDEAEEEMRQASATTADHFCNACATNLLKMAMEFCQQDLALAKQYLMSPEGMLAAEEIWKETVQQTGITQTQPIYTVYPYLRRMIKDLEEEENLPRKDS